MAVVDQAVFREDREAQEAVAVVAAVAQAAQALLSKLQTPESLQIREHLDLEIQEEAEQQDRPRGQVVQVAVRVVLDLQVMVILLQAVLEDHHHILDHLWHMQVVVVVAVLVLVLR